MLNAKIYSYKDYLYELSNAVIEKRELCWLQEFTEYFNGEKWVKKENQQYRKFHTKGN
jgi:hypothetical protein